MPQCENNMGYNAQLEIWVYTGKCTPGSVHWKCTPAGVHREVYTGNVHRRCTYECVHRDVYTVPYTPLYIVTLILFNLSLLNSKT